MFATWFRLHQFDVRESIENSAWMDEQRDNVRWSVTYKMGENRFHIRMYTSRMSIIKTIGIALSLHLGKSQGNHWIHCKYTVLILILMMMYSHQKYEFITLFMWMAPLWIDKYVLTIGTVAVGILCNIWIVSITISHAWEPHKAENIWDFEDTKRCSD